MTTITPKEDKNKPLFGTSCSIHCNIPRKMKSQVSAEQETSLVSSLATDEKLQRKPLPETIGLEKILEENDDDDDK